MHYYRGSNWDHKKGDFHEQKTIFLDNVLKNSPIILNNVEQHLHERAHSLKGWNGKRGKYPEGYARKFFVEE